MLSERCFRPQIATALMARLGSDSQHAGAVAATLLQCIDTGAFHSASTTAMACGAVMRHIASGSSDTDPSQRATLRRHLLTLYGKADTTPSSRNTRVKRAMDSVLLSLPADGRYFSDGTVQVESAMADAGGDNQDLGLDDVLKDMESGDEEGEELKDTPGADESGMEYKEEQGEAAHAGGSVAVPALLAIAEQEIAEMTMPGTLAAMGTERSALVQTILRLMSSASLLDSLPSSLLLNVPVMLRAALTILQPPATAAASRVSPAVFLTAWNVCCRTLAIASKRQMNEGMGSLRDLLQDLFPLLLPFRPLVDAKGLQGASLATLALARAVADRPEGKDAEDIFGLMCEWTEHLASSIGTAMKPGEEAAVQDHLESFIALLNAGLQTMAWVTGKEGVGGGSQVPRCIEALELGVLLAFGITAKLQARSALPPSLITKASRMVCLSFLLARQFDELKPAKLAEQWKGLLCEEVNAAVKGGNLGGQPLPKGAMDPFFRLFRLDATVFLHLMAVVNQCVAPDFLWRYTADVAKQTNCEAVVASFPGVALELQESKVTVNPELMKETSLPARLRGRSLDPRQCGALQTQYLNAIHSFVITRAYGVVASINVPSTLLGALKHAAVVSKSALSATASNADAAEFLRLLFPVMRTSIQASENSLPRMTGQLLVFIAKTCQQQFREWLKELTEEQRKVRYFLLTMTRGQYDFIHRYYRSYRV